MLDQQEKTMKTGDLVMFIDEGRYAKWFFGKFAEVLHYTPVGHDGKAHCRVKWINPVKYYNGESIISDFSADKFEICEGNL